MKNLFRANTLYSRTALALALGFSLFALFSVGVLQYMLVQPQTRQAADDLAAFLVLAGQVWVELPPNVRPDYERELFKTHHLKIIRPEARDPVNDDSYLYLDYLQQALQQRIKQPVPVHRHPDHENWIWVDFSMANHRLRIGFLESRLKSNLPATLTTVISTGIVIAFLLSLLLVWRVARPLGKMAEATRRIGKGDFGVEVPESGPKEIAELAGKINLMQKQIQQLLENRTTLLAGISHDLRTPLARMRLELEMLDGRNDEKRITAIIDDLTEMDHLISQTLLLARGLKEEEIRETDINELLQKVVSNLQRNNTQIQFTPSAACFHAVRENALKRVLINLIENAVNYSGGLPVSVSCNRSASATTISVSDQGPGIPPDQHKAIFQPFYRLESSRSKASGGSGLGLAIVRQLCDANGWNTEISSPAHGGTTVQIQLPDKLSTPETKYRQE